MEHVDLALGGCLSRRFFSQASSRRLLVRSAGGGVRDCSLRLSRLLSSACSSACRSWMLERWRVLLTPARALLVVVTNGRAVRCVSCSSRGQPGAPMKNGRRSATNLQQPTVFCCLPALGEQRNKTACERTFRAEPRSSASTASKGRSCLTRHLTSRRCSRRAAVFDSHSLTPSAHADAKCCTDFISAGC